MNDNKLMYRDHMGKWWLTEADAFEIGSQGELRMWKVMEQDEDGKEQSQFIECVASCLWEA